MAELYIGLMSGTSMDGIDTVLIDLSANPDIIATKYTPYENEVRDELISLCAASDIGMKQLAGMDTMLGQIFAQTVRELLQQAGTAPHKIKAIGSHGQTIRHEPHAPIANSLQIGNPNIIAEITGIATVADFRRRDIAAGGEGAPLVPAFHNKVFRTTDNDRVVINIGGIANITLLPMDMDSAVTGFDTGPGNVLMDAWSEQHLCTAFDTDGQWGASGNIHNILLETLLEHPFFNLKPPKSTGREQFNLKWLDEIVNGLNSFPSPQDIQATLCELTAISISKAISSAASQAHEILVCGGGVHNKMLMRRLGAHLIDCSVQSTEKFGVHPDWVESAAFAWLAKQTMSGQPGNLPSVTGAKKSVVLGGIYTA